LNEYYISSSHNTYLLGKQVKGFSSIEGYIHALKKGCKCIEIDIWDGLNGPVVSHGLTFTSPCMLKDVLLTIKKYAFENSSLPLMLSIEIHCKKTFQVTVKNTFIDILGGMLIIQSSEDELNQTKLPSPLDLQNKVIMKIKRSNRFNKSEVDLTNIIPKVSSYSSLNSFSSSGENGSIYHSNNLRSKLISKKKGKNKNSNDKFKIIPQLCAISYVYGLKFKSFSLPESKNKFHCFSFSEKTINSMLKDFDKRVLLDKHNRRYLNRIYPSGLRVNSSNFNPIDYWKFGCQFVATNWQTKDLGQQLNESMFNNNNCSGYVLKPEFLRSIRRKEGNFREQNDDDDDFFNAQNHRKDAKIIIDIISGLSLKIENNDVINLENNINSYVEVEVFGQDNDSINWGGNYTSDSPASNQYQKTINNYNNKLKFKSCIVSSNGFNPVWNNRFEINLKNCFKEFLFIRLTVKNRDEKNHSTDIIGRFVARLIYLKEGYRHLPIYDSNGDEIFGSKLFVKLNYI
ncbi:phosphatidylinositol phospholipase C, partial [Ascoidea rubescens DSM 1968]